MLRLQPGGEGRAGERAGDARSAGRVGFAPGCSLALSLREDRCAGRECVDDDDRCWRRGVHRADDVARSHIGYLTQFAGEVLSVLHVDDDEGTAKVSRGLAWRRASRWCLMAVVARGRRRATHLGCPWLPLPDRPYTTPDNGSNVRLIFLFRFIGRRGALFAAHPGTQERR